MSSPNRRPPETSMSRWKLALPPLIGVLFHPAAASAQDAPGAIYVRGKVVTLDPQNATKEALAVKGEKILAVGTSDEIRKLATDDTKIHDLNGKVMVPGFYAAHDHFPSVGEVGLFKVDLSSPPVGKIEDMDDLISALKEKARQVPEGRWVTGRGYDDTLLKEGRHPTRHDLDKVSISHPIWITHVSGHLGVANTEALKRAKITRDTAQPPGGRIRKDPSTGEPDGVFEESLGFVTRLIPGLSEQDRLRATEHAVRQYVSKGVTTAVIASGGEGSIGNLERALAQGLLPFRIITMTSGGAAEDSRERLKSLGSPKLKAGAIKLLQDGSIQGFTGYLSQPYYTPFGGAASYRGYALRARGALTRRVKDLHRAGYQIAIHGNGDSAIDDILSAFTEAQKDTPRPDARHRIEHCQTVREDQLDTMSSLGVTPSYFVGHVYYWGDRHASIFLGPERAARISPLASTARRSIRFTVHDDTPVTPVNPLQLVWVSANRITMNNRVLGPEERISPEQALRAITIDAAWQNIEEHTKGSLEAGKLADFVILDNNPVTVEPARIRDIQIMETVVGGATIYKR